MGKKGVWKEKTKWHNRQKVRPIFPSDLGFVACGCGITLPHGHWTGLHSFLIKFGFPLFSRQVNSDQAESLKLQGAPGCHTSLYICCDENFFTSQCIAWTPFIVKSTGIRFCSNQLEISFHMTHLIETSGSLMRGLASVISSLKTHRGS